MKKTFTIALLMLLMLYNSKAQSKRMISMQLSFNQVEIGFEHSILNDRFSAALFAGIGNQDINNDFDDFTSRLGIGYKVLSDPQNQILINTGIGVYFPNNKYYSIAAPYLKTGLHYTRFLGKAKKHGLIISAGYSYGKRDYKQTYSSELAVVSTIGTFKVSPINCSIGYGFKF